MKNKILAILAATLLAGCGGDESTTKPSLGDGDAMLPAPGEIRSDKAGVDQAATATVSVENDGEIITNVIDPSAPNGGANARGKIADTSSTPSGNGNMVSSGFNKKP